MLHVSVAAVFRIQVRQDLTSHMASIQPEDTKKALKSMFQSLLPIFIFILIFESTAQTSDPVQGEQSECDRNT